MSLEVLSSRPLVQVIMTFSSPSNINFSTTLLKSWLGVVIKIYLQSFRSFGAQVALTLFESKTKPERLFLLKFIDSASLSLLVKIVTLLPFSEIIFERVKPNLPDPTTPTDINLSF